SRKGNHFCLSSSDSEYLIDLLLEAIRRGDLALLHTDNIRYASINLKSLFIYGSVEFRSLESTTDHKKILLWCKVLKRLKDFSLNYEYPSDIPSVVSFMGWKLWAKHVLDDLSDEFLVGDWEKKIRKGVRNCQQISYGRDWKVVDLNIFNKNKDCFK